MIRIGCGVVVAALGLYAALSDAATISAIEPGSAPTLAYPQRPVGVMLSAPGSPDAVVPTAQKQLRPRCLP